MAQTRKRAPEAVKKAPPPFPPADYITGVRPAWCSWSFSSRSFGASVSWSLYSWSLQAEFSLNRFSATVALGFGPAAGHVTLYF